MGIREGSRGESAELDPAAESAARAPSLGLALSGGGVWGAAHLGVLRVLDEAGVAPDYIAGTSSGAIAGAFHAAGIPLARALAFVGQLRWRSLRMLGMPRMGLLHSEVMERFLRQELGDVRVEDLPVPMAIVATEFRTARPVVFREGPLARALAASSAIPVVFSPVRDGEALLVDGGLSDNLPVQICRGMGADVVLAVNVVPGFHPTREFRNLLDVAMGTLELLVEPSTERGAQAAELTVHPDVGRVSASDLAHTDALVSAGESAMRAALPRLESLLRGETMGSRG